MDVMIDYDNEIAEIDEILSALDRYERHLEDIGEPMTDDDFETGAPGTDPRIAEMHSRYAKGDKAGAQRILDEINAASGAQPEGAAASGTAAVTDAATPMLDAEVATEIAERITNKVNGGAELIAKLGGIGSAEFDEAVTIWRQEHESATPEELEFMNTPIPLPDGRTVLLGDDARTLWFVLNKAKSNRSTPTVSSNVSNRPPSYSNGAGGSGVQSQLNDLTAKIHAAQLRGDKAAAKSLDAQRQALARRAYGNAPAVGTGGRYA